MKADPGKWGVQVPPDLFSTFEVGQKRELRFGNMSIPVRVTEVVPPDTILLVWVDVEDTLRAIKISVGTDD